MLPLGNINPPGTNFTDNPVRWMLDAAYSLRLTREERNRLRNVKLPYDELMAEELVSILESRLPDFTQLRMHNLDYRVEPDWESVREAEREGSMAWGDTYPRPSHFDYWKQVNDHGNVTMFGSVRAGRSRWWQMLWSMV